MSDEPLIDLMRTKHVGESKDGAFDHFGYNLGGNPVFVVGVHGHGAEDPLPSSFRVNELLDMTSGLMYHWEISMKTSQEESQNPEFFIKLVGNNAVQSTRVQNRIRSTHPVNASCFAEVEKVAREWITRRYQIEPTFHWLNEVTTRRSGVVPLFFWSKWYDI